MKKKKCDILVVGSGPAGSSAARSAAMNDLKTIIIDKKKIIGEEVKCGEGIGEYLMSYLPFEIPKNQLIWKIDGMFFWTDNISVERLGERWKGYSINRENFDRWLSELAIKENAELFTESELISFDINEDNQIKKAIINRKSNQYEIFPKIVIAADGSESKVLKLLNLYNPKKGDLAEVYSWEMKNLNLYKPHMEQIFTGDFTPSGYAYIFPKSKNIANVGIGGLYPKKKMRKYFDDFLDIGHVKKQVNNAEYVIEKSKPAMWYNITDKWVYNNVILTGDAANQNLKPFIEGILPSIICGDIAGKIASNMYYNNNFNDNQYKIEVFNKLNIHFKISLELQKYIGNIFSRKHREKYLQFFGIVTELFNNENISDTNINNYNELKKMILKLKNNSKY
jgi:digeranylgeranylglycerophospholipid reductase